MAREKVEHWYERGDFKKLLLHASDGVEQRNEQDFVDDLSFKFSKFGETMFLSERQNGWLRSIAEKATNDLPEIVDEIRKDPVTQQTLIPGDEDEAYLARLSTKSATLGGESDVPPRPGKPVAQAKPGEPVRAERSYRDRKW